MVTTSAPRVEFDSVYQNHRHLAGTEVGGRRCFLDSAATNVEPSSPRTNQAEKIAYAAGLGKNHSKMGADILLATVYDVNEDFLMVRTDIGKEQLDINVPLELCPEDTQYEGVSVSISVEIVNGFKGLRVERHAQAPKVSPEATQKIEAVLNWVDAL